MPGLLRPLVSLTATTRGQRRTQANARRIAAPARNAIKATATLRTTARGNATRANASHVRLDPLARTRTLIRPALANRISAAAVSKTRFVPTPAPGPGRRRAVPLAAAGPAISSAESAPSLYSLTSSLHDDRDTARKHQVRGAVSRSPTATRSLNSISSGRFPPWLSLATRPERLRS